jgi:thioredoxin reductase (NADPH)
VVKSVNNRNCDYETIIVGGGPGGLVAAIYLQRFHRKVLIVDRGDSRARNIPRIQNLVGYSHGISGSALLKQLRQQALKFGTTIMTGEAVIYRQRGEFMIQVDGQNFFAPHVILATGIKDRQPPNVNYSELCRKGALAYCPICDGYDHTDERIAVIIDSNEGFRKIETLYNFTRYLHVVLIKDLAIPARHLEKIRKFKVRVHQGELQHLIYDSKKKCLRIKLKNRKSFAVKSAYVAMGFKVASTAMQALKGLRKTKLGQLIVNDHQETSVKGLYAVGDCVKSLAQVSVATGHAAIAATHIHNQLSKSKTSDPRK